ncbi:Leucine-rich repeat protein kinase family protein [Striga hermonthica]|uniref:Leucine-rich repeat protein kinase family protein n=1 Tax=Striga hermonthica TaxID=68872 RepID=A0A9N7R7Y2_STRHE|nr:Leucine-rich repeat protein kinase family protein [Striga hermonthica]
MVKRPHFFHPPLQNVLVFISVYHHYLLLASSSSSSQGTNLLLPSDASALLDFKFKADSRHSLDYSSRTAFAFCKWEGVRCSASRTVKLILEDRNLGGVFPPDTLTRLAQLRVLSLQNNSLTGPVPDLSGLVNLKALFLSRNYFSGAVPPSISALHRLKTLDLSYNMLAGPIPESLNGLDRLYCLRLDFNRFNGSVPPLNQSSLQLFNVSHNGLAGAIPVTPTLSRFDRTSFSQNPGLCGEIIHRECRPSRPFFGSAAASPAAAALSQTAQLQGGVALAGRGVLVGKHKRAALVIGCTLGASILVISLLCLALAVRKRKGRGQSTRMPLDASVTGNAEAVTRIEEENAELAEKVRRVQEEKGQQLRGKSGSLVFCAGEVQLYTMDQLMRASAELLGRGTMGTTYKAVLDTRLIVTVKRLDAGRLAGVGREAFEGHMDAVGGLRHPNLVPLRAYFQAREERLLVYDYQPNGSLFSLIHGSKSSKAKPLHWTSCLKIAEDLAQGLCYIHQAWRLVHGNLKPSNVLLGPDFEACLTDYCLVALSSPSLDDDPNSTAYKAPEMLKFNDREPTTKSDVYSFGILLLELLTGNCPSEHPNVGPHEMVHWMRSTRDEQNEENRLEMVLEVAVACCAASPEQRPTMWQVLKTVQEIKEVALMEDSDFNPSSGSS